MRFGPTRLWFQYPTVIERGRYVRYTLAFVEHYDDLRQMVTLAQAGARCSPRDQFCRKVGRELALQRLAFVLPPDVYAAVQMAYASRFATPPPPVRRIPVDFRPGVGTVDPSSC